MEISYSSLVNPPHPPLHMLAPYTSVVVVDLDYSSHSTVYNMNMCLWVTRARIIRGSPRPLHHCCCVQSPLHFSILYYIVTAQRSVLNDA